MKLLILSFIYFLPMMAMQTDERAGSRSLIVENHPTAKENPPKYLLIRTRNTHCPQKANNQPCTCFSDFSEEDLPSVQGNALITLAHKRLGSYFPGFDFDNDDKGAFLKIPSPEQLAYILVDHGYDHVTLVPGHAPITTDEYLALIGQGKIPLAEIALETEALHKNMLYQSYFHDVFNHLFLWIALPEENKKLIVDRAKVFIDLFANLEKKLEHSKIALHYIELAKFLVAAKLDVYMGTLNNIIFGDDVPLNPVNAYDNANPEEVYQAFVNFGLRSKKVYRETIFDPTDFVLQWFIIQYRSFNLLLDKKKHMSWHNLYLFYVDYEGIKKNPLAHTAFQALMKVDDETIQSAIKLVIKTAAEILNKEVRLKDFADSLPPFSDFCQKMEARYQKTIDSLKFN
jgi:hypothetical protein